MITKPIYRAKKKNTEEWVEGYYVEGVCHYIISKENFSDAVVSRGDHHMATFSDLVDPETLAIHLPNMFDKNDKRIFASLNEDGMGGDKLNIHLFTMELGEHMGVAEGETEFEGIALFDQYGIGVLNGDKRESLVCYAGLHEESIEVLGIYKGLR